MEKMRPSKKREPCLPWNMEVAQWYFRVALLPQALHRFTALNLCRAQWNQKTVKAFWSQTYSPVSEKLCLSHRSWIFQQDNDQKRTSKSTRLDEKKTLDCSEVACYESYWTSVKRTEMYSWEMAPIKPERSGVVCSRRVGQTTSGEVCTVRRRINWGHTVQTVVFAWKAEFQTSYTVFVVDRQQFCCSYWGKTNCSFIILNGALVHSLLTSRYFLLSLHLSWGIINQIHWKHLCGCTGPLIHVHSEHRH